MATHDYVIANASGAAVRSDLNNALAAIVSNNSNTTEPATTYAYQSWADTTAGLMKIRNSTNDDWVSLYNLDGSSLGPGKVTFGATEVVFNDAGNNVDFRIEGDTDANLFFVDASADKVGIGTTSPSSILDIVTSAGNLEVDALGSTSTKIRHTTTGGILALEGDSGIRFDIDGDNEKARLDSSGRLLVGTSSSSADTRAIIQGRSSAGDSTGRLYISSGNNSPGDGDGIAELYFSPSNHTATARIAVQRDGGTWTAGSSQPSRLVFSTTPDGSGSPVPRMTISNGGKIYANTTADPVGPSDVIIHAARTSGNAIGATVTSAAYTCYTVSSVTDGFAMWMYNTTASANVGSIKVNAASVSYTTTSDYRLKENIVPLAGAIDRVNQLQVHRFNFIADPDKTVDGFIAHEAQQVVPECAIGTKDEVDADGNPVYQGIDQSKLVPLLTAALQEALAEIDVLKAKVAALEAS